MESRVIVKAIYGCERNGDPTWCVSATQEEIKLTLTSSVGRIISNNLSKSFVLHLLKLFCRF
ncbi:hypothetical protein TSMEX_004598 [Taenia solium]|eukprot:TsM_000414000 transcript=TsM_000414000 gene=TsM_000414000